MIDDKRLRRSCPAWKRMWSIKDRWTFFFLNAGQPSRSTFFFHRWLVSLLLPSLMKENVFDREGYSWGHIFSISCRESGPYRRHDQQEMKRTSRIFHGHLQMTQKEKKKTADRSFKSSSISHLSSFSFFLFVEGWIVMVCLAIFRWGTLFHHFLIQLFYVKDRFLLSIATLKLAGQAFSLIELKLDR